MPGRRGIDAGSKFLNWILAKQIQKEKLKQLRRERGKDISPSLIQQGGAKKRKRSWAQAKQLLEMNGQLNRRRGSGQRQGPKKRKGKLTGKFGLGGRKKKAGRKRRAGAKKRRAGAKKRKAGRRRKAGRKRKGGARKRRAGVKRKQGGRRRKQRMHPRTERGLNQQILPLQTKAVQLAQPQRTLASKHFSLQKKVGLQPMSSLDLYRDRL